jgi:hypothetical protein
MREVAYGKSGLMREVAYGKSGLMREVAYGKRVHHCNIIVKYCF